MKNEKAQHKSQAENNLFIGESITQFLDAEIHISEKPEETQSLPEINAENQNLKVVSDSAWQALALANIESPYLFRNGGLPVRLNRNDNGSLIVEVLNPDRLRHEAARKINWYKPKSGKDGPFREPAKPPMDVVKDMLANPEPPLPVLERIVAVPVFAKSGKLQIEPGYHAETRDYYDPESGFELESVPDEPDEPVIAEARRIILDELIVDFPFADEADRAQAVGLLLLPFARDLINGATPNHIIEASTPGTGKSLLSEVLLFPASGHHIGIVTQPQSEDEWRKNLTSQLMRGHSVILIDNLTKPLDSGTLAGALTAPVWTDRVLGGNSTVSISVRCIWVTTANNPTMSTEIARRSVRIRLDASVDQPWMREGFRHENLSRWVTENRAKLVWAALTLIQAWLVAGRPRPQLKPLGSYEQWSLVIGGILEFVGIHGFLSNLKQFYEAADVERAPWEQLLDEWWSKFEQKPVTVADLWPLASEIEGFVFEGKDEKTQRSSFGKQLSKQRDRVIKDFRIVPTGTRQRAQLWKLTNLNQNAETTLTGSQVKEVNQVNVSPLSVIEECSSIEVAGVIEPSLPSFPSLSPPAPSEVVNDDIETFDFGEVAA